MCPAMGRTTTCLKSKKTRDLEREKEALDLKNPLFAGLSSVSSRVQTGLLIVSARFALFFQGTQTALLAKNIFHDQLHLQENVKSRAF